MDWMVRSSGQRGVLLFCYCQFLMKMSNITLVLIPQNYRQKRQDKAFHFLSLLSLVFLTSLLLDNERWKQAEVPAEFQDLVDSVSDGRISLPEKKPAGMYLAVLLLTEFIISKCCCWMLKDILWCHSWSVLAHCLLGASEGSWYFFFFPLFTGVETSCAYLKRFFIYFWKLI